MESNKINLYLGDSYQALKAMPDGHYDLLIADPPYGIGYSDNPARQRFENKSWDNSAPDADFFREMRRVSNAQIIWGANHYLHTLAAAYGPELNQSNWITWYKEQPVKNFADCELAFTTMGGPARVFHFRYYGNLAGNGRAEERIHPTQKPVELYRWLLDGFAKPGQKICDPFLGSGSIAIAAREAGVCLDAWEIDPDLHAAAIKRYKLHSQKISLW